MMKMEIIPTRQSSIGKLVRPLDTEDVVMSSQCGGKKALS
jgi:hypothetical protein